MHRLVIARYAEDVDWVTRVPPAFEVFIANKGAPITSPAVQARAHIANRPNVGREGETYLSYIASLDGDEPMDGVTVFSQGDPFEHSPDFLELLACTDDWHEVQPLSWRWKVARKIPPDAILARETASFVNGLRVRPELFSLNSWAPLGFDDPGTQWLNRTYRALHRLPEGCNIAAHFMDMCGLHGRAAEARGHLLGQFAYGAVFAARNGLLQETARHVLSARVTARLRQATQANAVYGYVLERLWLHIFGLPFLLPVQIDAAAYAHQAGEAPPEFMPEESPGVLRRRKALHMARRVRQLVGGA